MSPHLSQLNVAMAHRNYFRRNNLLILKLATYRKIEDHYSRCKLATFGLETIAKCSSFILSTQNIKFYWFVMKIKTFLLPIWWNNRGLFPLGNKYFGVFVLNGLSKCMFKQTTTKHTQVRQIQKTLQRHSFSYNTWAWCDQLDVGRVSIGVGIFYNWDYSTANHAFYPSFGGGVYP